MSNQTHSKVIDDLMDMYVEWRQACVALRSAYERWSTVRVAERQNAFAEYGAALDWEEHTSAVYADRVSLVARERPRARARVGASRQS